MFLHPISQTFIVANQMGELLKCTILLSESEIESKIFTCVTRSQVMQILLARVETSETKRVTMDIDE